MSTLTFTLHSKIKIFLFPKVSGTVTRIKQPVYFKVKAYLAAQIFIFNKPQNQDRAENMIVLKPQVNIFKNQDKGVKGTL